MSQTPGIISLGQHIAGESQGISRNLIFHQKMLEGFDKCSKKRCEDLAT